MPNDVLGIISTVVLLTLIIAYIVGIFVYNARRKKKGKVSIFLETCSCHHEGGSKRLLKEYHKKYGTQGKCNCQNNETKKEA